MAEVVYAGTKIRVKVSFYAFDANGDSVLTDPTGDVTVDVASDTAIVESGIAIRQSLGSFYYEWTPALLGNFSMTFSAMVSGTDKSAVVGFVVIDVNQPRSIQTLGEDRTLVFMTGIDPLFADPDQLMLLFPDADPVEITELIYDYSLEVVELTGLTEPTPLMRDYVLASTACALSRIYDDMGLADEADFALGDLHVTARRMPKAKLTRGNASNWCELASVLRLELEYTKTGMKTYVKGERVIIPMPERKLQHQEWRSW